MSKRRTQKHATAKWREEPVAVRPVPGTETGPGETERPPRVDADAPADAAVPPLRGTSVALLTVAVVFFVSAAIYRMTAGFGPPAIHNFPPAGPMPEGYAQDNSPEVRAFRTVCTQCHDLPSPRMFDRGGWYGVVAKMGEQMRERRTEIPQPQIDLAVAYLTRHARPMGSPPPPPTSAPMLPVLPNLSGVEPQVVRAIEAAHQALATRLEDPEAWGALAMTYHAHHLFDAAVTCYRQAEALAPGDFRWPHLIGIVVEGGINEMAAVEPFQRAVELNPEDLYARVRLSALAAEAGDRETAMQGYRATLKIDPDCVAALVPLGKLYRRAGEDEAALRCLRQALRLAPSSAAVHAALAVVYARQPDGTSRAARHAREAARLPYVLPVSDPAFKAVTDRAVSVRAYRERAKQLVAAGKYAAAVEIRRKVVALRPKQAAVYVELGDALRKAHRFDDARRAFGRALELDPDEAKAYVGLAGPAAASGGLDRALETLDRALRLDPNLGVAYYMKGKMLLAQGKRLEALASFDAAVAIQPANHGELHVRRGEILLELGRVSEAFDAFSRAVALRPDLAMAHKGLGVALMQQQRINEAAKAFAKTAALSPNDLAARVDLVLAFRAEGKHEQANRALRVAQARWPNHPLLQRVQAGEPVQPQLRVPR